MDRPQVGPEKVHDLTNQDLIDFLLAGREIQTHFEPLLMTLLESQEK
jgi:hypothetical protein